MKTNFSITILLLFFLSMIIAGCKTGLQDTPTITLVTKELNESPTTTQPVSPTPLPTNTPTPILAEPREVLTNLDYSSVECGDRTVTRESSIVVDGCKISYGTLNIQFDESFELKYADISVGPTMATSLNGSENINVTAVNINGTEVMVYTIPDQTESAFVDTAILSSIQPSAYQNMMAACDPQNGIRYAKVTFGQEPGNFPTLADLVYIDKDNMALNQDLNSCIITGFVTDAEDLYIQAWYEFLKHTTSIVDVDSGNIGRGTVRIPVSESATEVNGYLGKTITLRSPFNEECGTPLVRANGAYNGVLPIDYDKYMAPGGSGSNYQGHTDIEKPTGCSDNTVYAPVSGSIRWYEKGVLITLDPGVTLVPSKAADISAFLEQGTLPTSFLAAVNDALETVASITFQIAHISSPNPADGYVNAGDPIGTLTWEAGEPMISYHIKIFSSTPAPRSDDGAKPTGANTIWSPVVFAHEIPYGCKMHCIMELDNYYIP